MKLKIISLALLFFTTSCLCADNVGFEEQVSQSLGKVILMHDKVWGYQDDSYKTGGFLISKTIDMEYKDHIAQMPTKYRLKYFWSLMMHVSLDASFLEDFILLIKKDCGKEFVSHIDAFIEASKKLKIEGPDQIKAKKIKLLLVNI